MPLGYPLAGNEVVLKQIIAICDTKQSNSHKLQAIGVIALRAMAEQMLAELQPPVPPPPPVPLTDDPVESQKGD